MPGPCSLLGYYLLLSLGWRLQPACGISVCCCGDAVCWPVLRLASFHVKHQLPIKR